MTRLGIALGVVAVLVVILYVDLKVELAELRGRLATEQPLTQTADGASAPDALDPTPPSPPPPTPVPDVAAPGQPPNTPPPAPCTGTVDEGGLRATVGRHGRDVFRCFEGRRTTTPELAGVLTIAITVDGSGRRTNTSMESSILDPIFQECVGLAIESWTLPPARDGACAEISLPFSLGTPH